MLYGRAALANDSGDLRGAEAYAREAREQARATGDSDLELALSQIGGALVLMGRVAEGTAMLDESDGRRAGREGGPDTVVQTSCATIVCLSRASELKRAAQWIRAAEDSDRRFGSTRVYAVCRTHCGNVLFALGRWAEAEQELQAAVRTATAGGPVLCAEAMARLAELRLAQGRLGEATSAR